MAKGHRFDGYDRPTKEYIELVRESNMTVRQKIWLTVAPSEALEDGNEPQGGYSLPSGEPSGPPSD